MRCSACGSENEEEFRFCGTCGTPLVKPRRVQPDTLPCPQCGYANEGNSKFCQECGTKIAIPAPDAGGAAPQVEVINEESVPSQGITIEFPFSTSQSFDFAVEAAKRFPTFLQFGEAKKAIYRVTFARSDLHLAMDLLEHLKGWRRRAVYVDGEKAPWDSVFSFDWCYSKRCASYRPEFYCFGYEEEYQLNLWGCIQSRMFFTGHEEWLCWGRWLNQKGDWEFDKERIRHELQKNLFPYRFCPAITLTRVEDVIRILPDRVNPNKDKDWKFAESFGDESGVGLTLVVDRFGFKEKVVMKGVEFNGLGAVKAMANRLKIPLLPSLK